MKKRTSKYFSPVFGKSETRREMWWRRERGEEAKRENLLRIFKPCVGMSSYGDPTFILVLFSNPSYLQACLELFRKEKVFVIYFPIYYWILLGQGGWEKNREISDALNISQKAIPQPWVSLATLRLQTWWYVWSQKWAMKCSKGQI